MRRLSLWLLTTGVLLATLLAAVLGVNPTLNLARASSGVKVYELGIRAVARPGSLGRAPMVVMANFQQFLVFLLVVFNFLLVFLPRGIGRDGVDGAMATILVPFVGGLLAYRDSWWNMRYYLGLIPIFVLFIVRGFHRTRDHRLRSAVLGLYFCVSGALILNFNIQTVFRHVAINDWIAADSQRPVGHAVLNLDSLRMWAHLRQLDDFANINRTLPPGATLFYQSDYYGDAAPAVYSAAGLFRGDIRVRHRLTTDRLPPLPRPAYVYGSSGLQRVPR